MARYRSGKESAIPKNRRAYCDVSRSRLQSDKERLIEEATVGWASANRSFTARTNLSEGNFNL
ncbi:hypothetical protein KIN20_000571 [Parelaphostrongylus tenuis]|uniref:Uncharacterized protein n=1 Tax=Parelaphostrongylus tenuis TaxID=148309 RepID=A0AAD5MKU8_PARTN|nr:hypothetical protein KIN20_000571 [Parelaphostrongylus tenuis]